MTIETQSGLVTSSRRIATYFATVLASNHSIELTKDYWLPSSQQVQVRLKEEIVQMLAKD